MTDGLISFLLGEVSRSRYCVRNLGSVCVRHDSSRFTLHTNTRELDPAPLAAPHRVHELPHVVFVQGGDTTVSEEEDH